MTSNLTRREFITVVSTAGGGLVLALRLPFGGLAAAEPAADFSPNIWLRIDPTGTVTITVARSELGQGAHTSMAMLVLDNEGERLAVLTHRESAVAAALAHELAPVSVH